MNNKEEILPIGTVCILKDVKKKIMIIGHLARLYKFKNKVYDYMGCLYPEGFFSSDKNMLFNKEDIEKVLYKGYIDDEQQKLFAEIERIKSNLDNNKRENT